VRLHSGTSWAQWAGATAAAATAATVLDALLLQRRRSFFTGGFLSVDHVTSPLEALAFLAGSALADISILGIAIALLLCAFGRLELKRKVALPAALALALIPVATADFIAYQLLTYLGDAFDLRLMFDLAGRRPAEILAVVFAHLASFAWVVGGAAAAIAVAVWTVKRNNRGPAPSVARLPLRRALALSSMLLLVGAVGTAALRGSSDVMDNGLRRKPTGQLLGAVMRIASDVDGDGFGMLGRPPDPDLLNASVRPYAIDIPGNGVDENGVGGDHPANLEPYRERAGKTGRSWSVTPDVILIVLESFRADAVGASLGGKPVTPVLNELAARGISVQHAYSHNGYTIQSRRHIFSGSLADLDDASGTLLDDFKANGYETAYFSAQDESFGGAEQGVGFDRAEVAYDARADRARRYTSFSTAGSLAIPYTVLEERVRSFLDSRRRGRPLFLYLNFHDTHFPYHHRGIQTLLSNTVLAQGDIVPGRADALREMYLNAAANVDRAIGSLLARARESLGHEPGVIVLSDHGESLFDEGFLGHGYALNDAQTRIPLIVTNLPITVEEPFGQADLRHLLREAFERPAAAAIAPAIRSNPGRSVFQYLGTFDRPAQIGFVGETGRIAYDFRARRVRFPAGDWRSPETLNAAEARQYLDLVRTWERMMLAKHAAASDGE
jgi:hypothetical protein